MKNLVISWHEGKSLRHHCTYMRPNSSHCLWFRHIAMPVLFSHWHIYYSYYCVRVSAVLVWYKMRDRQKGRYVKWIYSFIYCALCIYCDTTDVGRTVSRVYYYTSFCQLFLGNSDTSSIYVSEMRQVNCEVYSSWWCETIQTDNWRPKQLEESVTHNINV